MADQEKYKLILTGIISQLVKKDKHYTTQLSKSLEVLITATFGDSEEGQELKEMLKKYLER